MSAPPDRDRFDEQSFDELLERSSLGTPGARAVRAQADPATVARVLERVDEIDVQERERALAQLDALTTEQRLALHTSATRRCDLATLDLLDRWARRAEHSVEGFVIVDLSTGRRYIDRVYGREREAAAELASLLRGYPEGHEWRRRLAVRPRDWRSS